MPPFSNVFIEMSFCHNNDHNSICLQTGYLGCCVCQLLGCMCICVDGEQDSERQSDTYCTVFGAPADPFKARDVLQMISGLIFRIHGPSLAMHNQSDFEMKQFWFVKLSMEEPLSSITVPR
jgi:hypothetical protein